MRNFFKSLIVVSEKAANIARVCRSEKELFSLLVEEKKGNEGNTKRFFQDFKTLADVLVQESVRHDLVTEFPELTGNIKGEESNTFSNTLGASVTVEIKNSVDETSDLLLQVLDGNTRAAELLTTEVYRKIEFNSINTNCKNIPDDFPYDLSNVGIWIDPIDATTEYIKGEVYLTDKDGMHKGLQCVTVLIGVFDRSTGSPIAGVVNQPFYQFENGRWSGKCYWGCISEDINYSSEKLTNTSTNNIVVSSLEKPEVHKKLKEGGFNVLKPSGAGYKVLTVCLGLADAYVLSLDTIFKWDTCAPHAILKSLHGGIVDYSNTVKNNGVLVNELTYNEEFTTDSKDIQIWRHANGLIAFKSVQILEKIVACLSKQ